MAVWWHEICKTAVRQQVVQYQSLQANSGHRFALDISMYDIFIYYFMNWILALNGAKPNRHRCITKALTVFMLTADILKQP